MRPNWAFGLRVGTLMLIVNVSMAIGSYLFGCYVYAGGGCSAKYGFEWIVHHPVFPVSIPASVLFGFVLGAFGDVIFKVIPGWLKQEWLKSAFAWFIILLLIVAFALWGIPELRAYKNHIRTAPNLETSAYPGESRDPA